MRDLPGPRAFIERASRDLDAGNCVVLVFPTTLIGDGRADSILNQTAATAGAVLVEPNGPPLERRIVDAFGYGQDWRPSHDPLWDLAHWPALAGLSAAIRTWEPPLGNLLSRWESLVHEAGRSPDQRFRLLVGADAEHVNTAGLDRARLFTRVHWWWGVVDRIDTDLHIRRSTPGGPADPLMHAQLVEAVSWDLPLAESLPQHGGDVNTCLRLAVAASGARPTTGELPRSVREHRRPNSTDAREAPDMSVRNLWDRGDLDLWDGRYRPRLTSETVVSQITTLLWRAQIRVLFPYVEEHRAKLAPQFVHHARRAGQSPPEHETLELGDMYAQVQHGPVRLPLDLWEVLKAARTVRNDLAHGRPASPRPLQRLLEVMPL